MLQTARAILKRDPAAHSLWEVLLTYPGLHALFWHRIAHFLAGHGRYILAALVSRYCTHRTGVIIAPEAQIGKRVFIDHGTGVVIGATAIVEDDVTILHGVTLGARDSEVDGRRHPIVRQGAFIGANAQILGPISVGRRSKVGAGAVVLKDVPDNMTAVGNPARLVTHKRTGWVTYRYSEMIVGQRMEG